jgi:hypothetical protein
MGVNDAMRSSENNPFPILSGGGNTPRFKPPRPVVPRNSDDATTRTATTDAAVAGRDALKILDSDRAILKKQNEMLSLKNRHIGAMKRVIHMKERIKEIERRQKVVQTELENMQNDRQSMVRLLQQTGGDDKEENENTNTNTRERGKRPVRGPLLRRTIGCPDVPVNMM